MPPTDFKIKFDGEGHEVDLNTLLSSLMGFSTAIHEIQRGINPEAPVQIKVKALEQGSFLVFLGIHAPEILAAVRTFFTKENLSLGAEILGALVSVIDIKKHLKGDKPERIENTNAHTVIIENKEGQVIQVNTSVFNLYANNPNIDKNISKAFEAASTDENITSIDITDSDDKPYVSVPKSNFKELSSPSEHITDKVRVITRAGVHLNAIKLSWEQNIKWSFIFEGNKINADVEDPDFYKQIDQGMQFAKGDTMRADIEIRQEFDEGANAWINKSYKVVKVHEHIPRAQQMGFDFGGE